MWLHNLARDFQHEGILSPPYATYPSIISCTSWYLAVQLKTCMWLLFVSMMRSFFVLGVEGDGCLPSGIRH